VGTSDNAKSILMKKYIYILVGLVICGILSWMIAQTKARSFEVPSEGITFHEVPLVCNASPNLGCGSRSKPILADLENEASIKEAWLNEQGTITAIVWDNRVDPNTKAVSTIFRQHGKKQRPVKGKGYQEELVSFREKRWYRGDEVDELSIVEAKHIATQITDQLVEFDILSSEDAPLMNAEVAAYIQSELLTGILF